MISNKQVEKLEKSSVKLTLTVDKDNVNQEYKAILGQYSKQAQIPGFRKGKVPASVLERKFGESIKGEAAHKLIDKAYQQAMEEVEEKPLGYLPPTLADETIDLKLDNEFTFSLVYDIYPEIKLGEYKDLEVEVPAVTVGKKEITAELEKIQEQNAMVMDKADGVVAQDDVITINTVEIDDEGEEVEGTGRQDFVFTVGSGQNIYKMDEDLIGFKKDETQVITKEYPEDSEATQFAGKTLKIKVTVTAVKEKKLPEINDELAQDVSDDFETLADLEKDIKKKLTETKDNKLKEIKLERALDAVAEKTPFDIPESMISVELDQAWRNFANQNRMSMEQIEKIFGEEGKKSFLESWRPGVEKNVRHRLLIGKIVEAEKIETTEEEVEKEIEKQAGLANMSVDQAKDYFKKNNMTHALEHEIKDRKAVDLLLAGVKEKKGKKTAYQDLIGGNL
jgi:trigger factor